MIRPSARRRAASVAAILGVLAGCATPVYDTPPAAPQPVAPAALPAPPTTPPAAPSGGTTPSAAAVLKSTQSPALVRTMPRSRWIAVAWNELPGWPRDATIQAWPSLLKSCERPAPEWLNACSSARAMREPDETRVRNWLQANLQPFRVESPEGQAEGLITGYFEPLIEASRKPRPGFQIPLHSPPADLATRKPWWTRAQIESEPAARGALRGREVAYVADPLDALVLQIQGSGRLMVTEPDGRRRLVRAAFAGHNDQPYNSVGRWLVARGAFSLDQASWPTIKAWARANPRRVTEMLHANPRYVFFREEALPDPSVGPAGAQGVTLTPGRSIAVDRDAVPYGTPVWIDTTEPLVPPAAAPGRPLQRLVVAQDTGSAITGAVRADYFWGWGDSAEDYAGRMKQPLRMWILWPRG
jgi:membrane-bound lytic murein transglycosylase A